MKHYLLLLFTFILVACNPQASNAFDVTTEVTSQITRENILTPMQYGAVCDAEIFTKGIEYDPATRIAKIGYENHDGSITYRVATNEDIGKVFGYAGGETTIESITPDGHLVTTDARPLNNVIGYLFSLDENGTDATEEINQAILDLGATQKGGVVDIPTGHFCPVRLTQAEDEANPDRVSAIVIDKPLGVPITITNTQSHSKHNSGILWRWGDSQGHLIANPPLQKTDKVTIKNLKLTSVGFAKVWSTPRKNCIHIQNPFSMPDTHSRIENNHINHCGDDGIYIEGRGETHIFHNNIGAMGANGIHLKNTFDNKVFHNTMSGIDHACMLIDGSASTIVDFQKYFFCGMKGGTDPAKSAAVSIIGTQYRNGHIYFGQSNFQEIRGSCVYIEDAGLISFEQTICQGAGRQIGSFAVVPEYIADVHIVGSEAYQIDLGDWYSSAFPLYAQQIYPNDHWIKAWGQKNAFMVIEGDYVEGTDPDTGDTRTRGAHDIRVDFKFPEADKHVRKDFRLEYGMSLGNTSHGTPLELCIGEGCTNGSNPDLIFNGNNL